jgi:hypothetical protein
MKIIQAPRASAILYWLLKSRGRNQPWLLPANICPIVPLTFLKAGVPFTFVDIAEKSLLMDLDQAEALLRAHQFDGLLYAHTYGEASTPNEFFGLIKDKFPNLLVIDDRCLCIPHLEHNHLNMADTQLYSTGYAKIVDLNFGGYAFIKDDINYQPVSLPFAGQHYNEVEKLYKQAINERVMFTYADSDWLDTETPMPSWDDYRQQVGIRLTESLKHRTILNSIYAERLPVETQLPDGFQQWRFNIRVKNKQRVLDAIFASGLFASSHYVSLVGIFGDGYGSHADVLANDVINLFNDHHFSVGQAEQVCQVVLNNL